MNTLNQLNVYSTSTVTYTDESAGAGQILPNRYQINGLLDTANPVMENIEKLCSAAGSWLSYDIHEGKWGVVINQSGTSVVSFDDSNIIGNISVSGTGLQDLYNSVKVEFPHRELRDSADFVSIEIPDGDRNANEEDNNLNISYDIINDPVQANLLGLIELKQSRVDLVIRFMTDFSYINLKAGDIVDVTDSRFGFTAKKFRIIAITEVQDDDGALIMDITALEYDSDVYSTANLYKYTRTDENGIITIGSIGVPGTPQVTKYEIDSRPRIIIESTSPTGVVDGMEFWLSTDTALPEEQRSYSLIAVKKPVGGGVFAAGTQVILDYDNVSSGTFAIKTRGFNSTTVGPFSSVSGLIAFTSTQVTNAIGPNTGVIDSLGGLGTALGAYALLKGVDDLYKKVANTSSLFTKVFETFKDVTGIDLVDEADKGALNGLGLAKDGTLVTNSATAINFTGSPVTLTDNGGGYITVDISGTGGGSGYTGSQGFTGSQGPQGPQGPIGFTGSRGSGTGGNYVAPVESLPSLFTVGSKYPPDRNTFQDPITGATSDRAPIVGPYSIAFDSTLSFPVLYNIIKTSGKNIYLYKSNGTLVETLSSDNCELFTYNWGNYFVEAPGLQTNQAAIKFNFANPLEYGTDYYILMDEGILEYCNILKSPAILSPDIWNFRTAPFPVSAYTVQAASNVGSSNFVPDTSTVIYPNNTTICSAGISPQITVNFGVDRIATASTSTVTLQLFQQGFSTLLETRTTSGTLIGPRTFIINPVSFTNLTAGRTYRIAISSINNLRTALISINCGYNYSSANYGGGSAQNLTIGTPYTLDISSFNVSYAPFGNDGSNTRINKNTNIQLIFNGFARLGNSGNFYLRRADASIHQTFPVSARFETDKSNEIITNSTSSFQTIILNPTNQLDDGITYYLTADSGTVIDACGNSWPGTSSTTLVRFTTDFGPTVTTATYSSQSIFLQYDRSVSKFFGNIFCTGTLEIVNSGGTVVTTLTASTSSVVVPSLSTTATISLTNIWATLPNGNYNVNLRRGFLSGQYLVSNPTANFWGPLSQERLTVVSFTK